MPRPKKIPEYHEGPQAAENFTRAMRDILSVTRQKPTTEHTIVTDQITVETQHRVPRKKKIRDR